MQASARKVSERAHRTPSNRTRLLRHLRHRADSQSLGQIPSWTPLRAMSMLQRGHPMRRHLILAPVPGSIHRNTQLQARRWHRQPGFSMVHACQNHWHCRKVTLNLSILLRLRPQLDTSSRCLSSTLAEAQQRLKALREEVNYEASQGRIDTETQLAIKAAIARRGTWLSFNFHSSVFREWIPFGRTM